MFVNLSPIKFPQANAHREGFDLPSELHHIAIDGKVRGLPVFFDGNQYLSIWKCESIRARFVFLFTGKINLVDMTSDRIAPKALSIGNPFNE